MNGVELFNKESVLKELISFYNTGISLNTNMDYQDGVQAVITKLKNRKPDFIETAKQENIKQDTTNKTDKTKENNIMFKVNDIVKMIKTTAGLAPMKVGDEFVVTDINNMGVATINDHVANTTYYLSTNILEEYFVKVSPKVGIDISGITDTTEIANYVDETDVECLLDGGRIIIDTFFDKCTVVGVQLTNGFVIVESSSCIDPDNYDIDTGIKNCINKIIDKVYELQAFNIQEEVAIDKLLNEKEPEIMCDDDGSETIFSFTDNGWELEAPHPICCNNIEINCENCPEKNDCPDYDN